MQQLVSCRYSTCLLLWQGKEVGYSWNSLTCAWPWIWPKWPKEGFWAPQSSKHNTWSRHLALKSENRRSTELSFRAMKMWRLRWKDNWPCFRKVKLTAAFLAKLTQHRIPRHAGGAKAWVHLHQYDSDSQHQNWRNIRLAPHLCHPVPIRELRLPISKVFHPDMWLYLLLFPVLNISIRISVSNGSR